MIVSPATPTDAPGMADVLNKIIADGGTTAHQRPFDNGRMTTHYVMPEGGICCHVAAADGTVLGFQSLVWAIDPADPFPPGWAIIASFVDQAAAGRGIGRALFTATRTVARAAGVKVIDATIRADNARGLGFYARMGFVPYARLAAIPLRDGTPVDRVRTRYDL
jgi:GNAT superfamily N-acetyltransferase